MSVVMLFLFVLLSSCVMVLILVSCDDVVVI